jgi:superfamily II DNA or RNA helicase
MSYLGKKGYTIFKKDYSEKQLNLLRNDLNIKPYSTHSVTTKEYPIYRESSTKMYIPRYYGIEQYGDFNNTLSKGKDINLKFVGQLYDYQYNIIDKYIKHAGESGGGLLDVEPGKGKTVMALNIISKIKKKTLVVVHKSFLMNQWEERIHTFLPDARIGRIQADVIDVEDKDIVLGMIQSLSNKEYDTKIWDDFGLCIYDECHHLSAEVFSNIMIQIVCNYNLGLSGTMIRKDGLTNVFKYFIGPVIHKEITDITTEVLIKSIKFKMEGLFDDVKTDYRGNPLYSTMINKLNCPLRNNFIIQILKKELSINSNQQIMILSNTKCLIEELFDKIIEFEPSVGYYVGGMKEEKLKESESKKIILATFAMASEGLDIKTLTTLIMATPKSDVCQSIGRILRSKHSNPLVIDIIDPHIVFKNQYKKRNTYYKSKNYKIQLYDSQESYSQDSYLLNNIDNGQKISKCLIKI